MQNSAETGNSLKFLKIRNRKLVLAFMRKAGAVSVNEISRATGLSKMTVHKIIDHYIQEGMVAIVGKGASTEEGGKKPNLFSFNPDCHFIFAIRLDGNRLATSIVNLRGETLVDRDWRSLENMTYDETIRLIGELFAKQTAENGFLPENCLAAVSGCSGIVDAERGIGLRSYQQPLWEPNLPLLKNIQEQLPGHVFVHVDSWWRHMARSIISLHDIGDRKTFFLVGNAGDYVSGGLVEDGRVCQGATGFAGEIGHMIVDAGSAEKCVCGGIGCLESLVAPSRVAGRAQKYRDRFPDSVLFSQDGANGGSFIKSVAEAASRGDGLGLLLLDETTSHLAVAINNIIHVCDPGLMVLFGDYALAGEIVVEQLSQKIRGINMAGVDKRTEIERSFLDEDSGVIGAANYITDILFAGGV